MWRIHLDLRLLLFIVAPLLLPLFELLPYLKFLAQSHTLELCSLAFTGLALPQRGYLLVRSSSFGCLGIAAIWHLWEHLL